MATATLSFKRLNPESRRFLIDVTCPECFHRNLMYERYYSLDDDEDREDARRVARERSTFTVLFAGWCALICRCCKIELQRPKAKRRGYSEDNHTRQSARHYAQQKV